MDITLSNVYSSLDKQEVCTHDATYIASFIFQMQIQNGTPDICGLVYRVPLRCCGGNSINCSICNYASITKCVYSVMSA